MLTTQKYARKPFFVDAVRVTEDNLDQIAQWCGGEIRTKVIKGEANKYVHVPVKRALNVRQTQAFIGDWVLYAGSGFKVFTHKAFETYFDNVYQETLPLGDGNLLISSGSDDLLRVNS